MHGRQGVHGMGGMHCRGHTWHGVCVVGEGACMARGMHGGGPA